jgi:hypothetical protein
MTELENARWLLRQRLLALARELRHWKAVSRRSGSDRFWTHHSQICAFALIIHNLSGVIHRNTHEPEFTADDARANSKDVLALFRIWEFFRGKLAQRLEDRHSESLQLADEFAWACYKTAAAQLYKEPPLVFLNGGFSPFTLPRNRRFDPEYVPNELIQGDEFTAATARLPFPVIGVPWYQAAAPWELPVIAHEVGHSIEGDLRLEKELRQRIEAAIADPQHRERWKGWCTEIFADFYACHAVGPAFVSNLAEFLEGAGLEDQTYPPPSVRLLLNLEFLGDEFAAQVAKLKQRWAALLEVPLEYRIYAKAEASGVAKEFESLRLGLTRFSANDYANAYTLASDALAQNRIDGLHDVRTIVAAIRIAYDATVQNVSVSETPEYLGRLNQLVEVFKRSAKPDIRALPDESDAEARRAAHLARSKDWLRRTGPARVHEGPVPRQNQERI